MTEWKSQVDLQPCMLILLQRSPDLILLVPLGTSEIVVEDGLHVGPVRVEEAYQPGYVLPVGLTDARQLLGDHDGGQTVMPGGEGQPDEFAGSILYTLAACRVVHDDQAVRSTGDVHDRLQPGLHVVLVAVYG